MIRFELPIRTINALNERTHWRLRANRTRSERLAAYIMVPQGVVPPCAVSLTRIAPRAMDGDGLQASFKALRDGIADRLGVKDNDPRVSWSYAQARGKPKQYAVRVEIECRQPDNGEDTLGYD